MPLLDPADGGFASRKMIMVYVTMALGFVAFLACAWLEALRSVYGDFCMFLLGATSMYVGGNLGKAWILSRSKVPLTGAAVPEPEESPEPEAPKGKKKPPAEAEGDEEPG